MNTAQLHLLVNHLPVFGAGFGAALTAAGLILGKDDLKKAGLWTLLLAGLSAVPAQLSGEGAEEAVEHLPGVAESLIHAHEEAAEKALIAVLAAAGAALAALAHARWAGRLSNAFVSTVLAVSLPALGLLGWTAHLGGEVRHTEIRDGGQAEAGGEHDEEEEEGEASRAGSR